MTKIDSNKYLKLLSKERQDAIKILSHILFSRIKDIEDDEINSYEHKAILVPIASLHKLQQAIK